MRAILMAAGVGSRLGTDLGRPKCTMDVNGEPLIRHTVKMLRDNSIKVALVVGYKKEMVKKALEGLGVTYYYNPFYRVTNSMGSLWFSRNFISAKEELILGNADVYWEQDILDRLLSDSRDAVMLSDSSRIDCGDYFFKTEDGRIVNYGKDLTRENRDSEYVGLAKLKSGFLYGFKQRLNKCVEDEIYDLWWENVLYQYSKEIPVYTLDVSGHFWGEIDYMYDYDRILNYVKGRVSPHSPDGQYGKACAQPV